MIASLLWMSISGSILILILLLCRYVFRSSLNPKWQFALWCIVGARLLLPFQIELPVNQTYIPEAFSTVFSAAPSPEAVTVGAPPSNETAKPEAVAQPANGEAKNQIIQNETGTSAAGKAVDITTVIFLIWACGTSAVIIYFAFINIKFYYLVRKNGVKADSSVDDMLGDVSPLVNIKRKPKIVVSDIVSTPCLIGLFNSTIVLTSDSLESGRTLRHVLIHELCHYEHNDVAFYLIRNLVLAIHWFNPLVWMAASAAAADCELMCDERVLALIGNGESEEYGETILSLAQKTNHRLRQPAFTMRSGQLRRRIGMIIKRPHAKKPVIVAASVMICAFFLSAFVPVEAGIPASFDEARRFSEGIAAVRRNDKWGFIDKSGRFIAPLKYESVCDFSEGLAVVVSDGQYGLLDNTGALVIQTGYAARGNTDNTFLFNEGLCVLEDNGAFGVIDRDGNAVVPFVYRRISAYSGGYAIAVTERNGLENYSAIDRSGNVVTLDEYEYAEPFSDGLMLVKKDDRYGFVDGSGNIAIPFVYDEARSFSEGLAAVRKENNWGIITTNGQDIIITHSKKMSGIYYEYIGDFSGGYADARLNGKWGVLSNGGNVSIQFKYDIPVVFSEGLAAVSTEGMFGFIDDSVVVGKLIIPHKYEQARSFKEGLAAVCENGKWGFIDKAGNIIVPMQYEAVSDISEGMAWVKSGDKWGAIAAT